MLHFVITSSSLAPSPLFPSPMNARSLSFTATFFLNCNHAVDVLRVTCDCDVMSTSLHVRWFVIRRAMDISRTGQCQRAQGTLCIKLTVDFILKKSICPNLRIYVGTGIFQFIKTSGAVYKLNPICQSALNFARGFPGL